MGYEMGFSIVKKSEHFDIANDEIVCLNYWCSAGKPIFNFVAENVNNFCNDIIELSVEDLKILKAKLNSAFSGSDIVGVETMKYLLEGIYDVDDPEQKDFIVTKAKGIHANIPSVLMAVNNFYWGAGDMEYDTFINFRDFINGIAYMNIKEDYELIMWRSY